MSAETTDDRDGTRAEIMEATYQALCAHGYADLTIQRIADQFSKSKSLLYYHYDSKDALLVDFLDFLSERFVDERAVSPDEDADDQLRAVIDTLLPSEPDEDKTRIRTAMLELRAQAPYSPAFREQFRKNDRAVHDMLVAHVAAGIDQGVYRDADPDEVAEFIHATINGAILRDVTLADPGANPAVRAGIDDYLDGLRRDE